VALCLLWVSPGTPGRQSTVPALAEKSSEQATIPETPAQIELLETRVRFEADGDSRKEVHARVHINSELGVRQFSHLSFNFSRPYEQIEIPLVHITHKSGGTADILPSAITDQPNPAVAGAPAYQDVRVKSVRILGLEPADILEYRVVTTTTHRPLAPDFWLDHSFDRTGVVSQEIFEIDVPSSRKIRLHVGPSNSQPVTEQSGEGDSGRSAYRWNFASEKERPAPNDSAAASEPDIVLTTFLEWQQLADRLKALLDTPDQTVRSLSAKSSELTRGVKDPEAQIAAIYAFVSQKIRTVDLPLGSTGFKTRVPAEILSSGYGTQEDKYVLFAALGNSVAGPARAGLLSTAAADLRGWLPRPDAFDQLLTMSGYPSINFWLDLNVEVAPFRVVPSQLRRRHPLVVGPAVDNIWQDVDDVLPFRALQNVRIDATIAPDGTLDAKVKYSMRGDNELLLRVAFHQSPRDKWKDVAQLMSLSDGFRGKILSASASDPYATKQPFSVEYEITQPKFVDWSKMPVRIPAPLPLLSVPDLPVKREGGAAALPVDLGTPLDVDTRVTLRLPPGTSVEVPPGTVVDRDYATFVSRYNAQSDVITASRHINFLHAQVPADRADDYAAFLHAVQTDQAQRFTLTRTETTPVPPSNAKAKSATSKPASEP
jgi:hypothetical protein